MAIWGIGLGRPRTRLGRWLDDNGVQQGWLEKKTGISDVTMTKLCGDKNYSPRENTKRKILYALREIDEDLCIDDFWD